MKSDLNRKIEEIYAAFKKEVQAAKDEKDRLIADLLERAEEEYIEKIKKDIKL
ncbi:MAG: hypothetical protein PF572_06385 [Patescibacteria group bacterium]|jgi:DNA-binding ferritin-like protein|nr:hypothetical protein [Patescibacteria group bacterium]